LKFFKMEKEQLRRQLKEQIIKYLNLLSITPEEITDDMPLFGRGLGLDSIDSIELVVLLEREYGIKIENPKQGRAILVDVNTIAEYIEQHQAKATEA
jgi:acyl carrier protein